MSNDYDDNDDDDDIDDYDDGDIDDERGGLHKSIAHFRTSGLLKANIGRKKGCDDREERKRNGKKK